MSRPLRLARRSLRSGVRVPSMWRCNSSLGRLWMKMSMFTETYIFGIVRKRISKLFVQSDSDRITFRPCRERVMRKAIFGSW